MPTGEGWSDWHLTPRGWERSNRPAVQPPIPASASPPDRVMTCRCHEVRAWPSGASRRSVRVVWHCGSPDKVLQLVRRYGDCMQHINTLIEAEQEQS